MASLYRLSAVQTQRASSTSAQSITLSFSYPCLMRSLHVYWVPRPLQKTCLIFRLSPSSMSSKTALLRLFSFDYRFARPDGNTVRSVHLLTLLRRVGFMASPFLLWKPRLYRQLALGYGIHPVNEFLHYCDC